MILANLSPILPDLAKALSNFGSAPSNLAWIGTASYVSTELCLIILELSQISTQFHSILEELLPIIPNLPMRRSIVSLIVETTGIRGRLVHQPQDRNHSSGYTNDYAFL